MVSAMLRFSLDEIDIEGLADFGNFLKELRLFISVVVFKELLEEIQIHLNLWG